MFGYLRPDLPFLYLKDDRLYKSLYCGVCKAIGKSCGQMARFSLSYDIAFLSAIAHNIIGKDVEIKQQRCIAHPVISRPVALGDELTTLLAQTNVLLAYYKACDDVYDNNKGKFKRFIVNGGYKKAKKAQPYIDSIIAQGYKTLREEEKNKQSSIDVVADAFSGILQKLSKSVLGVFSTEYTENLFYFIGKWIYLIDALDDYDKDIKEKTYNPFFCAFNAKNAKELLQKNGNEVATIFNGIVTSIKQNYYLIDFAFNKDLIENILLKGIPAKTTEITKRILNND